MGYRYNGVGSDVNDDEDMHMMMLCSSSSSNSGVELPAPFLTKTYQLVDDCVTDNIVSWGEDETSFVVWRPSEFATNLLPNYFKHNNFSSFVRQLNTYGFKKVVADKWEFANKYFKKGSKHLLSQIHRRKTPQHNNHINYHLQPELQTSGFQIIDHNHQSLPKPHDYHHHHHILSALTEDNQRLRKKNYMLLSELTHMKNLYNDIIYFIQNHLNRPFNDHEHQQGIIDSSVANNNKLTEDFSLDKIEEDPIVKLFGVPLSGKKRLHPEN